MTIPLDIGGGPLRYLSLILVRDRAPGAGNGQSREGARQSGNGQHDLFARLSQIAERIVLANLQ